MAHEEYLRRNLNVAKATGAGANAREALKRLNGTKRPPSVPYLPLRLGYFLP